LLNSECILFWFTFTGIKCSEKWKYFTHSVSLEVL
jgi:hypothetical protein